MIEKIVSMKLIINTTNLVMGGALQVALSFLNELRKFGSDEYHIFLSNPVSEQLDPSSFPDNFKFYLFEKRPASIRNRLIVVKELNRLEKEIQPDVVFSVFGPTYWRPQALHVAGFADGTIINPDSCMFHNYSFMALIKQRLKVAYKKYYTMRDIDYYIGETEVVRQRLNKYFSVNPEKVYVVSNNYGPHFDCYHTELKSSYELFKLVTISANYPHKNLQIIVPVIEELKKKNFKCQFHLTIPQADYEMNFSGMEDWVVNHGPIAVEKCPELYGQCDALFLPTLLESFTASYPEAMKMERPILTSDLDFAHTVCGDAAEYFDPFDPVDIANKIIKLATVSNRYKELVELGKEQLKKFPSARERAEEYIRICKEVANS